MTRAIGILAIAVAVGMAGCQGNGMNSGDNGGMNQNSGMNGNNGMSSTDKRADNTAEGSAVSATDGMPTSDMQQMSDQQFVDAAGAGGMYEIKEAKMAEKMGATGHVKAIGKRLVADHTRLANELKGIAEKDGLTLPSDVTPDLQEKITTLQGKSGMDFDKEYLMQQEQAHRETIAAFEAEAKGGKSAALRQFAAKALPVLKGHLMLVTQKDAGSSL